MIHAAHRLFVRPSRAASLHAPRLVPLRVAFRVALLVALLLALLATLFSVSSCHRAGDREGGSDRNAPADRAPRAAHPSRLALVTRVIDGDTVVLDSGERVRYIGIDSPEKSGSPEVVALGRAATEHNRRLVEGKTVRLEFDVRPRDRHGRLLAYVYVDAIFVNARMVEDGYAFAYTVPPDVQYAERFRELERQAREERRGLWGEEPGLHAVERRGEAR